MSYDRHETSRRRQGYGASTHRSTLGYWVPLVLTVTVATIGLAAWIWKERSDDDDHNENRKRPGGPPPALGNVGNGQPAYARGSDNQPQDDATMMARMSGALRRTPSPQQIFDSASRHVVAGVAAAGAAVGGALSSIREEDKRDFEDHTRWSEEAKARVVGAPEKGIPQVGPEPAMDLSSRQASQGRKPGEKKKAVAICVSAESKHHRPHEEEVAYIQAHASILSHLPDHIDDDCRVFILIYSPDLKKHPLAAHSDPSRLAASITSSYSNIEHEDLHSPGEEIDKPLTAIEPNPDTSPERSDMFNALYAEAQGLVEKPTMIMPFTTATGYVSLLRHIAPEVVYVQSTLSGPGGDVVKHISGWVGQVVLVVGDDSGHGGLVDSEDERGAHGDDVRDNWWHNDPKIGLGKGIEVVDGLRIGEHWRRRVRGHD
ncbi:hypothetical protein MMC26_002379 [Xylographa opegraphella]|nr:hypothetical protein [Xylographa opegraphella]